MKNWNNTNAKSILEDQTILEGAHSVKNVAPCDLKKLRYVSNTSKDSTNPGTLHNFPYASAFQLDSNCRNSEITLIFNENTPGIV